MIVFSKRGVVFGLVLLFSLGVAGSAWASCIYNKTKQPVYITLDCGFACSNGWRISPSKRECRPGKGGSVLVNVMNTSGEKPIDDGFCEVNVNDHGWVSIYQDGKNVTVKSKDKNGSVRERCTMKILGKTLNKLF